MEDAPYHRHDIGDRSWDLIKDLLPGQRGQWGGVAEDSRRFIDAVFWVLGTGAPWRDLPPGYGGWKNAHRRFCRRRDKGVWERLPEAVVDDPDFERLMVDSACVEARRDAAGAVGGAEAVGRAKGGVPMSPSREFVSKLRPFLHDPGHARPPRGRRRRGAGPLPGPRRQAR